MAKVLDYAWGRPGVAALKAAGVTAVCRYLCHLPNGKALSRSEADGLRAGGIDVVSNWEAGGSWAEYSQGAAEGRSHAIEAGGQHTTNGGPAARPIYFSTDFNPTSLAAAVNRERHRSLPHLPDAQYSHWLARMHPDRADWYELTPQERGAAEDHIDANAEPRGGQLATIADYYRGVIGYLGATRVGAYGGYATIKYLFDHGVIDWGWQTYAWSGGQWDGRAQLRQVQNGITVGGVDSDLDQSITADFGQWGYAPTEVPEMEQGDKVTYWSNAGRPGVLVGWTLGDLQNLRDALITPNGTTTYLTPPPGSPLANLATLDDRLDALAAKVDAIGTVTLTDEQVAQIAASVVSGHDALSTDDLAAVEASVKAALREGTG